MSYYKRLWLIPARCAVQNGRLGNTSMHMHSSNRANRDEQSTTIGSHWGQAHPAGAAFRLVGYNCNSLGKMKIDRVDKQNMLTGGTFDTPPPFTAKHCFGGEASAKCPLPLSLLLELFLFHPIFPFLFSSSIH